MLPKWHIFLGLVFSCILVCFFKFSLIAGLIVFLSSVAIDIDHYFIYVLESGDLSFNRFWKWSMKKYHHWQEMSASERKSCKRSIFFFHGIEFCLIIIALSYFSIFFLWILFGLLFHIALDNILIVHKGEPLYLKASQTCVYIKNKNKKKLVL